MLDQLISALKLSLGECKKYEEPAEYIYQLNQVLNRYKTNLFKMVENKDKILQDPKELIQLRILTKWRTQRGFWTDAVTLEQAPVMLHVSGFIPLIGKRQNRETGFNKAVDVSDIIDIERIRGLKTDYHKGANFSSPDYKTEEEIIKEAHPVDHVDISLYTEVEKTMDEVINFQWQLSGVVYYSVLREHEFEYAKQFYNGEDSKFSNKKSKKKKEPKEVPTSILDSDQPDNLNDQVIIDGIRMSRRTAMETNTAIPEKAELATPKPPRLRSKNILPPMLKNQTLNRRKLW